MSNCVDPTKVVKMGVITSTPETRKNELKLLRRRTIILCTIPLTEIILGIVTIMRNPHSIMHVLSGVLFFISSAYFISVLVKKYKLRKGRIFRKRNGRYYSASLVSESLAKIDAADFITFIGELDHPNES